MFWKSWSWPRRILSVVTPALVAAVLYPVFVRLPGSDGRRGRCQPNLKQIGLALLQYQQDYDNHFPPVATGGAVYGWADAIQPYVKSTIIYHCPSAADEGQLDVGSPDPMQGGYIDYPFNANLEQKSMSSLDNAALQIMSLDGNDGRGVTNARYCLNQISPLWFQDENSPLYRHLKMGNILFADGHVKSMRPQQLSTNKQFVF